MIRTARILLTNKYAFLSAIRFDIKNTIASTRLGPLWLILDPLVLMAIYTFVIKFVFNRGGANYHIFALCGIVTWQVFARSLTICSGAMIKNSPLIKQAGLPLEIYVITPSVVQGVLFSFGLLMVAIWNYSILSFNSLFVFVYIVPMVLLSFSFGTILSIVQVYFPDTKKFLPYMLRVGFYLSPVLYDQAKIFESMHVSNFLKFAYSLNPMIYILEGVRDILYYGNNVDYCSYLKLMFLSLLCAQFSLVFFRRYSKSISKYI